MISTLIIEKEIEETIALESKLTNLCPQVKVAGRSPCLKKARKYILQFKPQLVIIGSDLSNRKCFELVKQFPQFHFETIYMSQSIELAYHAIQHHAVGFLLKPVKPHELIQAVYCAEQRIQNKQLTAKRTEKTDLLEEIIGIPTMEGLEFLQVASIIRCEGLQKCTRVITENRSDIVSSYNVGEFRKLLEHQGFFTIHKSHLVNLRKILRLHRDGTIEMTDGSTVPVSRRRKSAFLQQVKQV